MLADYATVGVDTNVLLSAALVPRSVTDDPKRRMSVKDEVVDALWLRYRGVADTIDHAE